MTITAETSESLALPPAVVPSDYYPFSREGTTRHVWSFEPAVWPSLNPLRRYLRSEEIEFTEKWQPGRFDCVEPASLARLQPVKAEGRELTSPVTSRTRCPVCGRVHTALSTAPSMRMELARNAPLLGLFRAPTSGVFIAHDSLVGALERAGLLGGLETFAVKVTNHEDTFVGLRAPRSLGWPQTPYGAKSPPCPCGATSPLYEFYSVFERPEIAGLHWFHHPLHGEGKPTVSAKLYNWLKGPEGLQWLEPTAKGQELSGRREGWFPDDVAPAFLSEEFHDLGRG